VRAHDPSTIVKCKDEYWVFCTGPGVRSYRSRDLKTWEAGPRVFDEVPAWARKFMRDDRPWAPDVAPAPGGGFFLYYSASMFGKNTSAIGLAFNRTLDPADPQYKWEDRGPVITSQASDNFNAIDPAVLVEGNGHMGLAFGSFWSGIKGIRLDPATGKSIAPDSPLVSLANSKEIEAAYVHRHDGKYYLFVNHGLCCRGVRSTYEIRVGRSDSPDGPYLDKAGRDLRDGGGTLLLGSQGSMIGPGHAGIVSDGKRDWLSFHFYDATNFGRGTLGIRPLVWEADGWPVVEEEAK
jgi:arabinan endo-1,5-alpha-L-arabinosidase